MKRMLTWVLVMVLCAMPLSGLAAETMEGKLYTLSIGNVSFALNGAPEQTIGATLNLKGGMDEDGRFLFGADAQGGETAIGRFTLSGDGENLLAYLDGMSSAYGVTVEQLKHLMAESVQPGASELSDNFDMEALQGMIEGYVGMLMDLGDPENLQQMENEELQRKLMALYGIDPEAEPASEQVTVLGETMTLLRYDMRIDKENVDALYDVMSEVDENVDKFWSNYKKFCATAMGVDPDTFSLSAAMTEMGMDMSFEMAVWGDEAGEWARVDMKINMTVTEDGRTETIVMPYVIEAHAKDDAIKMAITMDMAEIDAQMKMTMDAAEEAGVVTMKMNMDMAVEDETVSMGMDFTKDTSDESAKKLSGAVTVDADGEQVKITVDGAYQLAEDGAETLNGSLTVMDNGQETAALALNYAGAISKGEGVYQRGGRLTFSADAMGDSLKLGADVNYKHEPLTDEAFAAIEALPQIDYSRIVNDEQAQEQAMVELQTVMINALGAMMQTPGVAELIAQSMAAVNSAAGSYDSYGYDDYGYGYDDGEDEQMWQPATPSQPDQAPVAA